jgi:hypothetical protein
MPEPLYHVTYYAFLAGIAEEGLQASGEYGLGQRAGAQYAQHSQGKLFLTEADGVSFWHGKLQEHAEAGSDHPYEDGLTVVVLRVLVDDEDLLEDDPLGTEDARAPAYYVVDGHIEPDEIMVWAGARGLSREEQMTGWIPVEDWHRIDPSKAWTFEEDPDFDPESGDGEEGEGVLAWSKDDYDNPLYPPDWVL